MVILFYIGNSSIMHTPNKYIYSNVIFKQMIKGIYVLKIYYYNNYRFQIKFYTYKLKKYLSILLTACCHH